MITKAVRLWKINRLLGGLFSGGGVQIPQIKLEVRGDKELDRKFKRLARKIKHEMRPCYKRIGIQLLNEINETFAKEEYEGTRWKKLAPETMRARRHGLGMPAACSILQDTGYLRGSMVMEATNRHVKVGTPCEYAPHHHFGGRGGKPPKRPMIPSQKRGLQIAIEIADKFIDEKIKQCHLK